MKTLSKTFVVLLCTLLLSPSPLALAQSRFPAGFFGEGYDRGFTPMGQPGAPVFERTSPAWTKQVAELNFDGLPMGEVLVVLRKEFLGVNFICAPEVEEVPVTLKLRSVTLDDIFTALNITSKGEIVANAMNERMVSFHYRPAVPKERAPRKTTMAFSLASYLSRFSPDESGKAMKDLEQALEISWHMLKDANKDQNFQAPSLNLHAPTKMLIAVGTEEQLQVIANFVSQLERPTPGRQLKLAPSAPSAPQVPAAPQPSVAPVAPVAPIAPVAPVAPRTPPIRTERQAPAQPSTNPPSSNK